MEHPTNVFFSQKRTASNGHLVRSASEYILETTMIFSFLRLSLAEKFVYGKTAFQQCSGHSSDLRCQWLTKNLK